MNKYLSGKFSYLSFIMTLGIILYHTPWCTPTGFIHGNDTIYQWVFNMIDNIGFIAMGYFFTTTGFFLYYKLVKHNLSKKISKRVHSLLIPYLIWNVIYLVFYYFKNINGYSFTLKEIVLKLLFEPYAGPLWYMFAVFVLCIFAPFMIKLKNKKKLSIMILSIITISCYLLCNVYNDIIYNSFQYGWYLLRLISYLPSYFLGAFIGLNFDYVLCKNISKKVNYLCLFAFILTIITSPYIKECNSYVLWIIYRLQPILLWYSIPCDLILFSNNLPKIFESTFMLYALHRALIVILTYDIYIPYIEPLPRPTTISMLLIRLLFVVSVVFMARCIHIMLQKISPNITSLITGGRS